MANDTFIGNTFKMPPSMLPIANLGELLFIVQRDKEAFALLDMALKVCKQLDPSNPLQFKTVSLLGALL